MSFYPVTLEKVKDYAARKSGGILSLPIGQHTNVKRISNSFGETITRVDGEIPADLKIRNGERLLFVSFDQSKYTHALHKYPSRLSPEIAGWLIERYSKPGDIILDPFCGGGTVNLEALMRKRHSVGTDTDPFSRFLSKVKTTSLNEAELNESMDKLLRKITYYTPELVGDEDIPDFPFRDKWYQKEIVLELSYLRKTIYKLRANEETTNFFLLCLSSILRDVSNAGDNDKGTMTVRTTRSRRRKIYPSLALTKFAEALLINSLRIIAFSNACPKNVITEFPGDSFPKSIKYPDGYFNLAISTAPDINSFDISEIHKPEIYWLDLKYGPISPSQKARGIYENLEKSVYSNFHYLSEKSFGVDYGKLLGIDIKTAYLTYEYLGYMKSNLQEVYRTLETGGKYIIATGNYKLNGEIFQTWKHLIHIAKQVGFRINSTFVKENARDFMKSPVKERKNSDRIIVLEK